MSHPSAAGDCTLARLLEETTRRVPGARLQALFGPERALTWSEIAGRARQIAARLRELGLGRGDVVGVLLPNSLGLVCAAFGVFRAGAALAPLAAPAGARSLGASLERWRQIAQHGGIRHVIASGDVAPALRAAGLDLRVYPPESLFGGDVPAEEALPLPGPDDLALVQYTSGSTASPKGVALTHRQVMAGIDAIVEGARLSATDVLGTWLPMSHDMGFISLLACARAGADVHFSTPAAFIKRPGRWLEAFARVGGTLYAGPNFSYDYLIDGVDEGTLAGLDLRAWRLALNGAEAIDPRVTERFYQHFAPAGFRPEAMFPVYGLAEATLAVAFPALGALAQVEWVDRRVLAQEGLAREVPRESPHARGVTGVGRAVPGLELRVVSTKSPASAGALPDRRVGQIEVRGPSVTSGYYRAPAATAAALREGWLATGDLGYVVAGQLFVTGRIKEVMKLNGETYFPDDVEASIKTLPGVHRRRCVALAAWRGQGERMAVLVETRLAEPEARCGLAGHVRQRITATFGTDAVEVYLLRAGSILLTTSGKYQRLAMRRRLESGEFTPCLTGAPAGP